MKTVINLLLPVAKQGTRRNVAVINDIGSDKTWINPLTRVFTQNTCTESVPVTWQDLHTAPGQRAGPEKGVS